MRIDFSFGMPVYHIIEFHCNETAYGKLGFEHRSKLSEKKLSKAKSENRHSIEFESVKFSAETVSLRFNPCLMENVSIDLVTDGVKYAKSNNNLIILIQMNTKCDIIEPNILKSFMQLKIYRILHI